MNSINNKNYNRMLKWNNRPLYLFTLLLLSFALTTLSQPSSMLFRDPLDVFSFDYSAHKSPLAYSTHSASVELVHKTKLIPAVKDNYGAVFLKKVTIKCSKTHYIYIFIKDNIKTNVYSNLRQPNMR